MSHRKKFLDPRRMTVVVERDYAEHLRIMAIQKSSERGQALTPSELIREAIEAYYPFSNEKQNF